MKRIVAIGLCISLLLAASCGRPAEESITEQATETTTEQTTETSAEQTTETSAEQTTETTAEPDVVLPEFDLEPLSVVVPPESFGAMEWEAQSEHSQKYLLSKEQVEPLKAFAWDSAAELISLEADGTNLCYSPLSLYYALSMCAGGAEGTTADELLTVLNMEDPAVLGSTLHAFYNLVYRDNEFTRLKLANSMWLDDGIEGVWNHDWVDAAAGDYFAEIFEFDLSGPDAGLKMGQWIAGQTEGQLTPEIEVDEGTLISLINTVYLSDQWMLKFDPNLTRSGGFTLSDGSQVTCDYMNEPDGMGLYYDGDGYTSAKLELKESSLTVVLPDEGSSIEEMLDAHSLENLFTTTSDDIYNIKWQVPRFTVEADYDLKAMLQTMGIESLFSESADLSSISELPLFIGEVRQGTRLSVNEDGLEAASYTNMMGGMGGPELEADMILDRPFLYQVSIRAADPMGVPAFIGICGDPNDLIS